MSVLEDIRSIQSRDPANPTFLEVCLGYNGFHAVLLHRVSHFFWGLRLRALARLWANLARIITSVEIHPQAQIGRRFFIDHGAGVVIGQTAVIGDDVTIYQGVTLGGYGRMSDRNRKRHPTVLDGAMIGAYAQVLGDIIIGQKAQVGANSVVTKDVPDGATVFGIPARIVASDGEMRSYGMPSQDEIDKIIFHI
jgi:serine O-acetyltransferase